MLKPIPIQNVEYQSLGVVNVGPINRFMGVTTLDPYNAPPGTAASIKNLSGAGGVFPALAVRPGFAAVGSSFGAPVKGMGLHKNNELHAVAGGAWRRYSGGAWTSLVTGLSTTAPWSFTNFKGNLAAINLIGVNGIDTPRKYDGTTVTALAGLPAGVNFKIIDQHDNRLYASDGKAVYFCALRKPEDWTTVDDAGQIVIETNTGEDVCAIKAGMKHLMVFKPNMFAELWGTGPHNYQLQAISETGAVGLEAVAIYGQTGYWIHATGAFEYTGGLPRKEFSLPVAGYFASMNKAAMSGACAVATKDSVLFSIPTGASTVNDTTLEYLPDYGIWSVWQDFAPASWAYWNGLQTYGDGTGVYQATTNNAGVSWEWISPPFGAGPYSGTHQWYKLWHVIDVPAGSTLNVYVSTKAEGNNTGDWTPITSSAPIGSGKRMILPLQQIANSNFLRVKLTGTGSVKLHELNIQQREMPLR